MTIPTVAVLMTCHDRPALTERCVKSLFAQQGFGVEFAVRIAVADSSVTSETGDMLTQTFGSTVDHFNIARSNYWGGGMNEARHRVLKTNYDAVLWLNDDVQLMQHALRNLLRASRNLTAVAVGATINSAGERSYGGMLLTERASLNSAPVPLGQEQPCHTFNGNVVLIPKSVDDALKGIDRHFPHTMGDIDYGLRCTSLRYSIYQCASPLGYCENNVKVSDKVSRRVRLRRTRSIKEFPVRAWWTMTRRWVRKSRQPLVFLSPYLRALK